MAGRKHKVASLSLKTVVNSAFDIADEVKYH